MVEKIDGPKMLTAFVESVARLQKDGEGYSGAEESGERWVMTNDDAYDTLHSLIGEARTILGWEAGKAPLDTENYEHE